MTQQQDSDQDRRRSRATAVAIAVAAPLAVWLLAEFVLGMELFSPAFGPDQPSKAVGPVHVAGIALVASAAGWGLLAALERLTRHARTIWTSLAVVVLAFSLGGPFGGDGITTANQITLLAMHVAVGAVLIPRLYRSASHAPARTPDVDDTQVQAASVDRSRREPARS